MISLVLTQQGLARWESAGPRDGPLWLAGGVLGDEALAKLWDDRVAGVFDHPIAPGDGEAIWEALVTIAEHHPRETIVVEEGARPWLDELLGETLRSLYYRDESDDWVLDLGAGILRVEGGWRLSVGGGLRASSPVGEESPRRDQVEAARRAVLSAVGERTLLAVELPPAGGELAFDFGADTRLEFFEQGGGPEAWILDLSEGRWVIGRSGGTVSYGMSAPA